MTDISESTSTVTVVDDVVERLKADLRKAQPFDNGTVVRFVSVAPDGQHYHYAVIYAGGFWWFTGQGNSYFPKSANHSQFLSLMLSQGHRIVDLEVATGFSKIEL